VHDYHAVEALVERLSQELDDLRILHVGTVHVRADLMYSPEALEQAYEMLTPGTGLEGSMLFVEPASTERRCPTCRAAWEPTPDDVAGTLLVCPACGAPSAVERPKGLEIVSVEPRSAGSFP
jgi:Zn finger protein HypA/HybF involved in hydrogenase expression